jgi:hypothetical protein
MYYVYILRDPRDGSPFYVGKGKGHRYSNHWRWNSSRGGNEFKDRVIAKILEAGLEPVCELHVNEITSEEEAYRIEEELIKSIGRRGKEPEGCLTNICLETGKPPSRFGSENGFFGHHHSEDNKKLFSSNAKKQFLGKRQTPEHIAKRVANFDREAARQRRVRFNQSEKMRAVTAKTNVQKGRAKTLRNVMRKLEDHKAVLHSKEVGFSVSETRKQLNLPYMFVWQIFQRPDYYFELIKEADAK